VWFGLQESVPQEAQPSEEEGKIICVCAAVNRDKKNPCRPCVTSGTGSILNTCCRITVLRRPRGPASSVRRRRTMYVRVRMFRYAAQCVSRST